MQKDETQAFIISTVRDILERENIVPQRPVGGESAIFGVNGLLDSIQLVELMLALEDYCTSNGIDFNWNNDTAFSSKRSVYRSVDALAEYVMDMANGNGGGIKQ